MRKERIENAVDIINYAIKNNISVKEASVKCGFSDTYVKNTKADVFKLREKGILKDELFKLFNEAYKKYEKGDKNQGVHYVTGVTTTNVGYLSTEPPKDLPPTTTGEQTKFSVNGDEAEIEWKSGENYPDNHIKTLDKLLEICEVDLDEWKVKDYLVNKWDVTSWRNKRAETVQNFQVKARLERLVEIAEIKSAGEIFAEMVRGYEPPVFAQTPRLYPIGTENNLLEISIFDLHIGKLAWGGETYENYDVKIARERFLSSLEKLIQRASGFPYSRILFPVGNDFFNSDTIYNTTTKGTPQDEDLRWQKTFKMGTKLLVDGINLLKQTGAPVDVLVIPGNHDFERSYYLGEYLDAWFNNDPVVNIDNGASPRKYYVFGNVLLGFTHGSEEKESSLPLIMASDIASKPYWSETKFHEWHLGHIHRKRNINYSVSDNKNKILDEELGVTVRYLSSLTGTEEWHHKKGFVCAVKAADAFIWNDEFGLVAHLNTNLIIES
jgi:hypothetical protein